MNDNPCPTCQGRARYAVNLVCRTCGRDYSLNSLDALQAAIRRVLTIHSADEDQLCRQCIGLNDDGLTYEVVQWPCDTALAAGVVVDGAGR